MYIPMDRCYRVGRVGHLDALRSTFHTPLSTLQVSVPPLPTIMIFILNFSSTQQRLACRGTWPAGRKRRLR